MLVLSRKQGEQIRIGENVVVTVLVVQGNKVRVGIEAPRSLPVWRSEVAGFQDGTLEADEASPAAFASVQGSPTQETSAPRW